MKYFGINRKVVISYLGEYADDKDAENNSMLIESIVFLTEDELKTLRYNIDKALDAEYDAPVKERELVVIDENTILWKDETYVSEPCNNGECDGCVFEDENFAKCGSIPCAGPERSDYKPVIFIKKGRA